MPVRIAFVGAGSYTFGPSVLKQLFVDNRIDGIDLALIDVDAKAADLMAGVARRLADKAGVRANVSAPRDRRAGLDGADFVICSAAVQGQRRFAMDCEIIARRTPGHLVTEFGGVAGISYSLRQIAMIESLCTDMRQSCPNAWLLDSANPLPRLCQAAHELGVRTIGFCSASALVYDLAWRILYGERIPYPWTASRAKYHAVWAGLNHFTWLLEFRERATGQDMIPILREKIRAGVTTANPRCEGLFLQTGHWLLPHDHHCYDFLPPVPGQAGREQAFHGDAQERATRLAHLQAVAAGKAELTIAGEAWERPGDLIATMAAGRRTEFEALNLVNERRIADLPPSVFVETPAVVDAFGPTPIPVSLPPAALPYAQSAAAVTDAIVRAALTRSREMVHQAVVLDPTVTDKPAGIAAIDECLAAHADLLPPYR